MSDPIVSDEDKARSPNIASTDHARTLATLDANAKHAAQAKQQRILNSEPVIKKKAFVFKPLRQRDVQAPAQQDRTQFGFPGNVTPPAVKGTDLASILSRLDALETWKTETDAAIAAIIARLDAASIDATAECNTDGTITVTVNLHL